MPPPGRSLPTNARSFPARFLRGETKGGAHVPVPVPPALPAPRLCSPLSAVGSKRCSLVLPRRAEGCFPGPERHRFGAAGAHRYAALSPASKTNNKALLRTHLFQRCVRLNPLFSSPLLHPPNPPPLEVLAASPEEFSSGNSFPGSTPSAPRTQKERRFAPARTDPYVCGRAARHAPAARGVAEETETQRKGESEMGKAEQ